MEIDKELWNTLLDSFDKAAKDNSENFFTLCRKFIKNVNDCGGISTMFQMAMNIEEREVDVFTLREAVAWAKEHFNNEKFESAVLHRRTVDNKIELHLCFLDLKKRPLMKGEAKQLVVVCKRIDDELSEQFGKNDVIIFD